MDEEANASHRKKNLTKRGKSQKNENVAKPKTRAGECMIAIFSVKKEIRES